MEKIISYDELPKANGQSIYLRINETDPKLYTILLLNGYKIVSNIFDTSDSTIFVTGRRQDLQCSSASEYKLNVEKNIETSLMENGIAKPNTVRFSYRALINHEYKLPFVLKNENQNGGREKFLIATDQDYDNLIKACEYLLNKKLLYIASFSSDDMRYYINYYKYLENNFTVQEYIQTPTDFNTTVRLLTSSSHDLVYASLKYNKKEPYHDNTTLLGFLLQNVYKLSTQTIVSNTLSGGKNILIGDNCYDYNEKKLLMYHNIDSEQFRSLIEATKTVHQKYHSELGIICGFDYIYDQERRKWFLLEYHSRPMLGDYSRRQGINYETKEDRIIAEGRVRATALSLALKKR